MAYHTLHSSRFLGSEGLHHLEHIHHSLCLTPLNGGGYGTEHPTTTHRVTVGEIGHMVWDDDIGLDNPGNNTRRQF